MARLNPCPCIINNLRVLPRILQPRDAEAAGGGESVHALARSSPFGSNDSSK